MDAIWTYTISRDLNDATPPTNYISDARVAQIIGAVDLSGDIAAMSHQFSLVSDTTAVVSPGIVTRVIRGTLTADFMARHTTGALRLAALSHLFLNQLKARVPLHSRQIEEVVTFA